MWRQMKDVIRERSPRKGGMNGEDTEKIKEEVVEMVKEKEEMGEEDKSVSRERYKLFVMAMKRLGCHSIWDFKKMRHITVQSVLDEVLKVVDEVGSNQSVWTLDEIWYQLKLFRRGSWPAFALGSEFHLNVKQVIDQLGRGDMYHGADNARTVFLGLDPGLQSRVLVNSVAIELHLRRIATHPNYDPYDNPRPGRNPEEIFASKSLLPLMLSLLQVDTVDPNDYLQMEKLTLVHGLDPIPNCVNHSPHRDLNSAATDVEPAAIGPDDPLQMENLRLVDG